MDKYETLDQWLDEVPLTKDGNPRDDGLTNRDFFTEREIKMLQMGWEVARSSK